MKTLTLRIHPITAGLFALLCLGAVGIALTRGPLTPPSGAVSSTSKTLGEIEPRIAISATNTPGDASNLFVISQPGSYYLTGTVTGVSGKGGIYINASNVTVDLNGFALIGVAGSGNGVSASNTAGSMVVRNGTVSNWAGAGVDMASSFTFAPSVIESIIARNNGVFGIRCTNNGIVRNCTATNGSGYGVVGFGSSVIESCVASFNTQQGILVGNGGTVRGCLAANNTGTGIESTGGGTVIVQCQALSNSGAGFASPAGSSIMNCSASSNLGAGISVSGQCLVLSNICNSNGLGSTAAAGILVSGSGSRIEGNMCSGSGRGIEVTNTLNIIIRNTCRGNGTNWVIGAGNAFGPIVQSGFSSAGVTGNTAAGTLGSTDPNANFTQ